MSTTKNLSVPQLMAQTSILAFTMAFWHRLKMSDCGPSIHCVNHRLELAIKDAVSDINAFGHCDRFYLNLYFLFKNSGKLKAEAKQASSALNITHYPLPKIQGTRFVAHRRRGFNKLIHNWPALITVFDNARVAPGYRGETKAKIIGIANKLHDYCFLPL